MLADHGSEDSWGLLALDLTARGVRFLGRIDLATPSGEIGLTGSAAEVADVEHNARYRITFTGPLVVEPGGESEKLIAKAGETIVFEEHGHSFRRRE
jgi:hypothetical protein